MSHETNTFSPIQTTLEHFQYCGLYRGDEIVDRFRQTDTELGGFVDSMLTRGAHVRGGLAASAIPSGPVTSETLARLERELLSQVEAGPVDAVLLALHGAMVSEDGEACEVHLLRLLRHHLGPRVPVVCTLDLHANVADDLVRLSTALFPYKTNPHRDLRERGEEAATTLLRILKGEIQPVMALARCPLLPSLVNLDTSRGPMVEVVTVARQWEARPSIVNVAAIPGFPFADVPDAGFCAIAVADGEQALADRAAREVVSTAWALRDRFLTPLPSPVEALREIRSDLTGVSVIAEVADNVNAGSPGDATHLLSALLEAPLPRTVFAALVDPEAVARALRIGVGNPGRITVGGKASRWSGSPVTLDAYVRLASDGRFLNTGANNGAGMFKGFVVEMGRSVVLELRSGQHDLTALVSERRVPPIGPEMFRTHGIEPGDAALLAIKTRGHYWRPYPFVKRILEVDTPGLASANIAALPYRRLRRPVFPLDPVV
jgi:microcystin degradation protein MlrC